MKTRTTLWTLALGLALLAATVLQARSAARAEVGAPVTPVRSLGVAAEGRVVAYPGSEVRLSAERGGRLLAVRVQESQLVRKGDVVAEIESDELRAQLAEARARVAEAEAEIRLAEANLTRRERLVEQQIAAAHDLDQARRDVETARARRETARAQVERDEAQLRKSLVLAPISGTVIARHVDAGETVEAGSAVATIADLGRLRIEGEADEADAGALVVGAPAAITADGYPGKTWRGRVEEVPDAVTLRRLKPQDPARPIDTRVLAVKVAFAEATPLRLGTTVELRIQR